MECVILFRNTGNGAVGFITNSDGDEMEVFPNMDAAIALADEHPLLRAFPYQIVELSEL